MNKKEIKTFFSVNISAAVREILIIQVNAMLKKQKIFDPLFEIVQCKGLKLVFPEVKKLRCKRTEKEKKLSVDVFSLSITLNVKETPKSKMYCNAYISTVCEAMKENKTLGGYVDSVTVSEKKYIKLKDVNCGMNCQIFIKLRITVNTRKKTDSSSAIQNYMNLVEEYI